MKCKTCGRAISKTHEQRKLFHKLCQRIAISQGYTLRQIKEAVKEDYFGKETYTINGREYSRVTSSEEPDKAGYSHLIEYVYIWAGENFGISLDEIS